jgi:hypothetical protein
MNINGSKIITVPHSQDRILALAEATTHGGKFIATGGSHLMTDDFFKSAEVQNLKTKIATMEKDKVQRLSQGNVEDAAKAILVDITEADFSRLTSTQLDTMLKWHNVQKDQNNKKEAKLIRWRRIWEEKVEPPTFVRWTLEDESKLTALKKMEIDMSETAVGRLEERKKREAHLAVKKMDREERDQLKNTILEMEDADIDN